MRPKRLTIRVPSRQLRKNSMSRLHISSGNFTWRTVEETLAVADGGPLSAASVLITFDDGYIDNYSEAFPVLRSHGVGAVFFLPTAFVGTNHIPWWDTIAYIVKHSCNGTIKLEYPMEASFDLNRNGVAVAIMKILRLYKGPKTTDQGRFLQELKTACGYFGSPSSSERCFMSWAEVREMQQAGMSFGGHTHSHEILSKLSAEQEREELRSSREILKKEIGCRTDTLAYPVGNRTTFSERADCQAFEGNWVSCRVFVLRRNKPSP